MPSSSFPGASPSSSASSPLSYMIQANPPPLLTLQGHGANNGVPTSSSVVSAASSLVMAPPPPRPPAGSGRTGHPPLPRPPPRQCPRCGSGNTKFCYYNNYSRSQPRYLCRACRRHWTEGGTLRDVPVGGGRKARRAGKAAAKVASPSSSSSAPATATALPLGADVAAFPDMLRQVLFQPPVGGYGIDLSAWQQMAPPPQGTGDGGALGATTVDANCGAWQYWNGWQQDDVPGLDGAY